MTSPTSSSRPRIAVLGSCVTRDAFEIPEAARFELGVYTARSAMGSFMGRRTETIVPDYSRIVSNFQRRMVSADVEKQGRKQLRSEPFDVLLLDLIDERLPVARFRDGGVATVSNEFRRLGISLQNYTKIFAHTEEAWHLWKAGWSTFVRLLDEIGAREKTIVHCAHWVGHTPDGSPTMVDPTTITDANRWLEAAYERMSADLASYQFIDVADEYQVADPNHRWGLAPFHYVPAYYRNFLEQLATAQQRVRD
ncbi:DUF6270 domain-containing protein [Brachybacterium sp. AOP42-B2-9]|uniref:DUF6270 domain-containing protein n=1 Tax=Brachybacterium sp. AOP42-B2-9 TaxID=3457672 RepID=UPI004034EA6C